MVNNLLASFDSLFLSFLLSFSLSYKLYMGLPLKRFSYSCEYQKAFFSPKFSYNFFPDFFKYLQISTLFYLCWCSVCTTYTYLFLLLLWKVVMLFNDYVGGGGPSLCGFLISLIFRYAMIVRYQCGFVRLILSKYDVEYFLFIFLHGLCDFFQLFLAFWRHMPSCAFFSIYFKLHRTSTPQKAPNIL